MLFVGQFPYQMDDRGRVPIPPAYRAAFKEQGYVAQGTGRFLVLHTEESLAKAFDVVDTFPSESDFGEDVRRDMFSNTWRVTPDGQGRIPLHEKLVAYAGLKKEVVVAGTGVRLEIWDQKEWDAREAERNAARREAMNKRGGG